MVGLNRMLGVGKPYGPAPLFIGRDMRVIDNKALLLRLRNEQQVTQVIPKSKALPDNKVVVNWGVLTKLMCSKTSV
jgi:hypothetical protein